MAPSKRCCSFPIAVIRGIPRAVKSAGVIFVLIVLMLTLLGKVKKSFLLLRDDEFLETEHQILETDEIGLEDTDNTSWVTPEDQEVDVSKLTPYADFIPTDIKRFASNQRPGLIQQFGWNLEVPKDCRARGTPEWNYCDPPTCEAQGDGRKSVNGEYPRTTLLTGKLSSTLELVHSTLRTAWGPKPPKIDLYVRAGCKAIWVLQYFLESVHIFWPRFLGEVILVMDYNDRAAIDVIIPFEYRKTHRFRVVYEHAPCLVGRFFNQYAYLNLFRYSDAEYVVTIDSDCIFFSPVTPDLIFDENKKLLLPTSMEFQKDVPWDQLQQFFTNIPFAPLGHSMVTQPVNFHVASTFKPYFEWIAETRKTCYEDLGVNLYRAGLQTHFFCWMCQLKTFIVTKNLPQYNVFNVDVSQRAYVRYASHIRYELYRDAQGVEHDYAGTAQEAFKEGICKYLGIYIQECHDLKLIYMDIVTFKYAHYPLMKTMTKSQLDDTVKEYVSRFSKAAILTVEKAG